MLTNVTTGNAYSDGEEKRGWFVGSFVTPSISPRATSAVEVKWGVHKAGDCRPEWTDPAEPTTLSGLIIGRFCLQFPDGETVLATPGAYALWLPGIAQFWRAEADSVVLTVRW